jgi:transcriptional regulator with XRE-family HTH domain
VGDSTRQFFADLLDTPEARAEGIALDLILEFEKLREKQGLTYSALAERMGVSRAYVHKLMQGRQNSTVGSLVKLAAALGVELEIRVRARSRSRNGTAESNGHKQGMKLVKPSPPVLSKR